ncbi:hypothetical protein RFI_05098 [Reticulomyxa filosa]|uniref:Ricin B lectin domain-containing protein n=1 Tax=Reticulomyxa filosa TaxID=46433 RepID=X6MZQ9_RETFI|nr:hypothetical protein RFI_18717 [Reticulomyxa filosa]ETO32022.1 hypothetical protein RFI_05098 [Reticulomyxa filosa]|eukprot:ETO18550.1 hypothetical protein RFI_18717 [Reticulomyxa filosa]
MSIASNLNSGPFFIHVVKHPGLFWTIERGSKKIGASLIQQQLQSDAIDTSKLKTAEDTDQQRTTLMFPANDTSDVLSPPKKHKRVKIKKTKKLSSDTSQQFKLYPVQNGVYYRIKCVNSGLFLESKSNTGKANIVQNRQNKTDNQLWQFQTLPDGSYRIKNKYSNKYLCVFRGFNNKVIKTEGSPIVQQEWQNKCHFQFRLISVTHKSVTRKERHITDDDVEGHSGVIVALVGVVVASAAFFYYRRSRQKET